MDTQTVAHGVIIDGPGQPPRYGEMETRKLGVDDVLVSIYAAPVNPSDKGFVRGFSFGKKLPCFAGLEGSGVVVKAGENFKHLEGKNVAIFTTDDPTSLGSWGDFTVLKGKSAYPLGTISLEQGACAIVNPMTAHGLIRMVTRAGHRVVIISAAASALGRMLIAICKKKGLKTIGLVRKASYVSELKKLGATSVLDSSSVTFEQDLDSTFAELKPDAFLDCVTGAEGTKIISKLSPGSLAIAYGTLDQTPYTIQPRDLMMKNINLRGFILAPHLNHPEDGPAIIAETLEDMTAGLITTHITKKFDTEQFAEALKYVESNPAGEGKVLLVNNKFKQA